MGNFSSKVSCFCPDTICRNSTFPEFGENNIPENEVIQSDNELTEFERCDEISSSSPTGCSNLSSRLILQNSLNNPIIKSTRVVSRNALKSSTNLVQKIRGEFSTLPIAKAI
jgi:hypothetical protein